MREFHLAEWGELRYALERDASSPVVTSPALQHVSVGFKANVGRALRLSDAIHNAFTGGQLFQTAIIAAMIHLGKFPAEFHPQGDVFHYLNRNEFWALVERMRHGYTPSPLIIWATSPYPRALLGIADTAGGGEVDAFYESLMETQIVGVWTAFETLAGDLWEEAVNVCPDRLAGLTGNRNRIAKLAGTDGRRQSSAESQNTPRESPKISLESARRFTRGSYNLEGHIGSLLKEDKNFTRLSAIREAYSLAFAEETDAIDSALADRTIDGLSAVRNVIVHRAGTADQEYVDRAGRLPAIPQLGDGTALELDGKIVRDLVLPVIECTQKLIVAVDAWVVRNMRGA